MANKAIPFLLLPFLTKFLTPDEYGIVSLFQVLLAFLVPIVGLGAQIGVGKVQIQESNQTFKAYIGNLIIIFFFNSLAITLLLFVSSLLFPAIVIINKNWLYSAPLLTFCALCNMVLLIIFQSKELPWHYGLLELTKTIVNVSISIFLIYYLLYKWEGRFIGISVSIFLAGLISLMTIFRNKWVTLRFSKDIFQQILSISLPSIPHFLAYFTITFSDRIFIERMINKEELGIYSVGYSIGMIMFLLTDALVRAWSPWFYKKIKQDSHQSRLQIIKSIYLYLCFIVISGFLIICISNFLFPFVIDSKYSGALQYSYLITIAYVFRGVFQIFYPFMININKTKYLSYATVSAAIGNLILNFYLIPLLGGVGAAYATIFSFFISFLIIFYHTNRNYNMPWFFLI